MEYDMGIGRLGNGFKNMISNIAKKGQSVVPRSRRKKLSDDTFKEMADMLLSKHDDPLTLKATLKTKMGNVKFKDLLKNQKDHVKFKDLRGNKDDIKRLFKVIQNRYQSDAPNQQDGQKNMAKNILMLLHLTDHAGEMDNAARVFRYMMDPNTDILDTNKIFNIDAQYDLDSVKRAFSG